MQPFNNWVQLFDLCINMPMSEPQCRPFWEGVVYVSAGLALIITGWLIWKWSAGNSTPAPAAKPVPVKQAKKPLGGEQKKHDDPDPEQLMEDVTDPHLREKIRRELEQRRLQNMRAR